MEINTVPLVDIAMLWGPKIGLAIIIFMIFLIVANIVNRSLIKLGEKTKLNDHIINLLARTIRIIIFILGIISALGTLGINVSALIAGFGLTGFAVGFALKDTISNLLSGILLLMYQPFTINDRISVSGKEGIVTAIDLRYTTLVNDNTRILIPNSSLFTNSITIINTEQA
ncbi:hypothetical protein MNBD_GAMMA22-2115 [hydrothermal vent metagenome]|uniref:Small-conductance mechanosensitive channel n=1 Tax=hydrothermal vent metagenome TaxID=652676 RepID=A0A3B1A2S4_9ZZZZ